MYQTQDNWKHKRQDDLFQVLVTVDVFSLMGILQFVSFDVLPEGVYNDWSRLGVNSKKTSEARVQLELHGLLKNRYFK